MAEQRWIPLESNPDVLNKYIHNLGVPADVEFVDVYGLDTELLMMVPRPVIAVMLLFPITEKSEATSIGDVQTETSTYHCKQTIGNACGTVAIVHAVANNTDKIKFVDDAHFSKFVEDTLKMSAKERADYLQSDQKMGSAHEDIAQEGQTKAPSRDEKVNTHFIAFVCCDGKLYEMDGRKDGPVCHGDAKPDSLLEDTVKVVKKFMARDPDELNFTLMALVKKTD